MTTRVGGAGRAAGWGALVLACAAFLAISCGTAPAEPLPTDSLATFDRRAMLRSIGETVAIPLYQRFADRAEVLAAAAEDLCAAPDEAGLAAARQAWWDAMGPWQQAKVFGFGPYEDPPARLGPKIDFWPVREDDVEALLAGAEPVDADAVAAMGASHRGLPVAEYLLFAPGAAEALEDGAAGQRRCAYLVGVARDVAANGRKMLEAWTTGGYLDELVDAGAGSASFETLEAAVGELLNRMVLVVEKVRGTKLGKPMGKMSGGAPRPELLESPYAGCSVENMIDNLRGVESLYFGRLGGVQGVGFADYLRLRRSSLDPLVGIELREALQALEAIPRPLRAHLDGRTLELEPAYRALGQLHRLLGVDVANALGISVRFTDVDGD